jgi:uncharacterized protein (TIGR03437 family)
VAGSSAGNGTLTLSLATAAPWTATSSANWLTVAPSSGTGNATLTYTIAANVSTSSRAASINVAGRTFSVLQRGTNGNYTPWASAGNAQGVTIAGTGEAAFGGDGGPGPLAFLRYPQTIAVDRNANVYIADGANQRLRKVDSRTGIISTIAGNGFAGQAIEGAVATSSPMADILNIAVDSASNVYIADSSYQRILRIDAVSAKISTVVNTALYGPFGPYGLAFDSNDNLYYSDGSNRIQKVDIISGMVTTVAGNGSAGSGGDGGAATLASLNPSRGLALDSQGNLYFSDAANGRVRKVDSSTGIISTVAGNGCCGARGDGGPATAASLNQPGAIALDRSGNLFISDNSPSLIRRVDALTGIISTVAGGGSLETNAPALSTLLRNPLGLAVDSNGGLYVSDSQNHRVRFFDYTTPAGPRPALTGIVSSVDALATPFAPGSLVQVTGSQLSDRTVTANGVPWPTLLDDVSITINGVPAPVESVSPTVARVQIPYGTATGTATAVVTRSGSPSNTLTFSVLPASPAIFPNVLNADSTINSFFNPAAPGTLITAYFTGAGAMSPAVASGAGGPAQPLAVPVGATNATLGGEPVQTMSVAHVPGEVGRTYATMTVPAALAPGGHQLVISTNSKSGPARSVFVSGAPPVIDGLTQASSFAGDSVTTISISGSGFNSAVKVIWTAPDGAVSTLTPFFIQPKGMSVSIPSALLSLPGAASIVVKNGLDVLSNSVPYIIHAFRISSVEPGRVVIDAPPDSISISGQNMNTATVEFRTDSGQIFTSTVTTNQPNLAVTPLPAGAVASNGTVQITAVTSNGARSNTISLIVAPFSIASVTPDRVLYNSSGVTLTVTGKNLTTATTAYVSSPSSPGVVVPLSGVQPTEVTFTLPVAALITPGDAVIFLRDGAGASSNSLAIKVTRFEITRVSPQTVVAGVTSLPVSILGTDLGLVQNVIFTAPGGQQYYLSPSSKESSIVTATLPGNLLSVAGIGQIEVRGSIAQTSNKLAFSITTPLAPSSVTLTSPGIAIFGQPLTLSASVTPNTATGFVTFYDGAAVVGTSSLINGQATLKTSLMASGFRSLRAFYAGNAAVLKSYSSTVGLSVAPRPASGFAGPVAFPVSTTPVSLVVSDFDGNDIADLAVANLNGRSVSVLQGLGNAGFSPAVNYPAGATPQSVAVADLNRDGTPDVVSIGFDSDLTVRLGNSDGTLGASTSFAGAASAKTLSVGDVNSDGNVDVIVAGNGINFFLGDGSGSLFPVSGVPGGVNPRFATVADFNGDGTPDLVVAGQSGVGILPGTGNGSFGKASFFATDLVIATLMVDDFNRDGKADVATVNSAGAGLAILLGNGDGTLRAPVFYPAGGAPRAGITADFNGDALVDIAIANADTNDVGLYLGRGDGTFWTVRYFATGTSPQSLVAGDFNGDNRIDLATADLGTNTVSILVATPETANLSITKTHSGSFVQGQNGATYQIAVANTGSGATSGLITVADQLPDSLSGAAIGGAGWNCTLATLSCIRSESLAAGSAFPTINVVVNVAPNAPARVTNTAIVAGGGDADPSDNSASDATVVLRPQTIVFPALTDQLLDSGSLQPFGTATSGLPLTLASATPDVCTVSGATVSLASPGNCIIAASQNGDEVFAPAVPIARAFRVSGALQCAYSLSSPAATLPIGGGGGSFRLQTFNSCAWTATSSADWLTISSDLDGLGTGTITYRVAANSDTERTGSITAGGQTFLVRQFGSGCTFALDQSVITFPAAGGTALTTLSTPGETCAFTSVASGPEVTISPASGRGPARISLNVGANTSPEARSFTATIGGQTLSITQNGTNCPLSLGVLAPYLGPSGGQGSVAVSTPNGCPWSTSGGPNWITVTSGANGTGNGVVFFAVDPNPTTRFRAGSLNIGGQTFLVSQTGLSCDVSVNTAGLISPLGSAGGTGTILVTTNDQACSWTASTPAAWLAVGPPSSGTGNGSVTVTVSANATSVPRSARVLIGGNAVSISQPGTNCSASVSLRSATGSSPVEGGVGSVGVIAPPGCPWNAASNASWLTVSSQAFAGTGESLFTASPNTGTTARTGTITVAGKTFTVFQAGVQCSFTLNLAGVAAPAAGANGSVTVSSGGLGCAVAAVSYAEWVTVTTAFSGQTGNISYAVAENTAGLPRTAVVKVGDQAFTVTQGGASCTFTLLGSGALFGRSGGAGTVGVTASRAGCTPSTGPSGFVALGALVGPTDKTFTLSYTVPVFDSATAAVRFVRIAFGGKTFYVKQASW